MNQDAVDAEDAWPIDHEVPVDKLGFTARESQVVFTVVLDFDVS